MSDVDRDRHWPWLGFALEEGLKLGVTDAQELVAYATPEVLVAQLPHEVTTLLLTRALGSGTLTPASVLETAPPAMLAEHLESELLWRCLSDAAERHLLTVKGGPASDDGKRWLAAILQKALDGALLTPADVLKFVPPAEFVRDTPLPVMAEMIRTGLTRGNFDPNVVLQHLTPKVMVENLQTQLIWACVADAVRRHFELGLQPTTSESTAPHAVKSKLASAKIEPVSMSGRKGAPPPPKKIEPSEWSAPEDLEVLDDAPLPPPPAPAVRERADKKSSA